MGRHLFVRQTALMLEEWFSNILHGEHRGKAEVPFPPPRTSPLRTMVPFWLPQWYHSVANLRSLGANAIHTT